MRIRRVVLAFASGLAVMACEYMSPSAVPLRVGGAAVVRGSGEDQLNVRREPSIRGEIVGRLSDGSVVQVIDGPRSADGYTWWQIESDAPQHLRGWSAGQWLAFSGTPGVTLVEPRILLTVSGVRTTSGDATWTDLWTKLKTDADAVHLPLQRYEYSYRGPGLAYGCADTEQDWAISTTRFVLAVKEVLRQTPQARITVVAHSQGGLFAVLGTQILSDAERAHIDRVFTLSSPLRGVSHAEWLVGLATLFCGGGIEGARAALSEYILTGSSTMQRVAKGPGVPIISFGVVTDRIVPFASSALPGQTAIPLPAEPAWETDQVKIHGSGLHSEIVRRAIVAHLLPTSR